jgi:hypothetical protein
LKIPTERRPPPLCRHFPVLAPRRSPVTSPRPDGTNRAICYHVVVSNPQQNSPFGDDKPIREQIEHQPISARVPERVSKGVYTTGQLVLDGPKEFVIDFLQGMTRPYQIGARVVVTPQTMAEFIGALQENLGNYHRQFGPPPPLPQPPPNQPRPSIQEVYDNFKLPEDQLSGSYANSILIGHSPTEFFYDFITGFYPTPAVSSRVLMSASHVPRFLTMLQSCLEQYHNRYVKQAGEPPPMPGQGPVQDSPQGQGPPQDPPPPANA